jgi:hypothetical protein
VVEAFRVGDYKEGNDGKAWERAIHELVDGHLVDESGEQLDAARTQHAFICLFQYLRTLLGAHDESTRSHLLGVLAGLAVCWEADRLRGLA